MRKRMFFIVPAAVVGMVLFSFIGGEIVMRLWNWLTPGLFGWRQINFWQAFGLLALCRILFGGFGARGSMRSNIRRRMADRWDRRMAERCGTYDPRRTGEISPKRSWTLRTG